MYKVGIYLRVRKAPFHRRDERPKQADPSVRATPGHGAQDAQVLGYLQGINETDRLVDRS